MLLPARMAVLNHMSQVSEANVDDVMKGLAPLYSSEKQFTKKLFLDHLMALEANGLLALNRYELDSSEELVLQYGITDEGRHTVEKYIPKHYQRA